MDIAEDLNSSNSSINNADDTHFDSSETMTRIKMAENIKEIEKRAMEFFQESPIPFKFDFEDYENCKLNGQLKKMI